MIIRDTITCQRIQTILALCGRACLFLQSIYLQSIYLSSYQSSMRNVDDHVKSPKTSLSVIPVKTGIQEIQEVLDSRLRGSDGHGDFYECINVE